MEKIIRGLKELGEDYQVAYDVNIGKFPAIAIAEYHMREEKGIFGIKATGFTHQGKEANEYMCFVQPSSTDLKNYQIDLYKAAEESLLKMDKHHGFTFFSFIIFMQRPDANAIKTVKKFRRNVFYPFGWSMGRVALIDETGAIVSVNSDGKELKTALDRYI